MKLRLTYYVYLVLLCTSVISSTLLFLIVASENIQSSNYEDATNSERPTKDEKFSSINNAKSIQDHTKPNIKESSSLNQQINEKSIINNEQPILSSFDISNKIERSIVPENIEILQETLTQQPNLSQGISLGEAAVVLTLVDTAATLKNLAEKSTIDYRSSSPDIGNASRDADLQPDNVPQLPKILDVSNLLPELRNQTIDESLAMSIDSDVVVVRAEQRKSIDNPASSFENEEQISEDYSSGGSELIRETQSVSTELNDSSAKARLVDESSNGVLDGFVTSGPSEHQHEDIPSFNEWAQKRLEEAEKKKNHPNASVQTGSSSSSRGGGNMRVRSKNYASPDCGAKVVAANPESSSARSILASTRDEYMLNTCTSRIWFVVELCEAIQAKKIELANFELFSSSPKNFSVMVSDRYPTREWLTVGQFTARDERDVQNFPLQPKLFGKFIKVELHSHYGSEHFCPISLFRAYGTSEFEVLETETDSEGSHVADSRHSAGKNTAEDNDADPENENEEDILADDDFQNDAKRGNLFGSARDAVLSIVRKAAAVLEKTGLSKSNNITKIQESIRGDVVSNSLTDCITPRYSVHCKNCSDDRIARLFQIISCRFRYLESLIESEFIYNTLARNYLCEHFFYDEISLNKSKKKRDTKICKFSVEAKFLSSLFTPDYVIAMCNILAIKEQRLILNASQQQFPAQKSNSTGVQTTASMKSKISPTSIDMTLTKSETIETLTLITSIDQKKSETDFKHSPVSGDISITRIKPTKPSISEDLNRLSTPIPLESSRGEIPDSLYIDSSVGEQFSSYSNKHTISPVKNLDEHSQTFSQEHTALQTPSSKMTFSTESSKLLEKMPEPNEDLDPKNDFEINANQKVEIDPNSKTQPDQLNLEYFDFKDIDVETLQNAGGAGLSAAVSETKTNTPQQKESVFLRLSNRIKVLERDISLSSQYLEELSKRYKKQVEEMQRSLERAVNTMAEESRKGEERELKRKEEITFLKEDIKSLSKSIELLLYERDNWHIRLTTILQHVVFVLVDVVLVILILSYCRRTDDLEYEDQEDDQSVIPMSRGRSYEIIKETIRKARKPKIRRPSEIACNISGTYNQLMIDDGLIGSRKEKRKKRKKDSLIVRSISMKENRSSKSVDNICIQFNRTNNEIGSPESVDTNHLKSNKVGRTESAPEYNTSNYNNQYNSKIQSVKLDDNTSMSNMDDDVFYTAENISNGNETGRDSSQTSLEAKSQTKFLKISSPSFMKTAWGSRFRRMSNSSMDDSQKSSALSETKKPLREKLESLSEIEGTNSDENSSKTTNGRVEESDESRSSTATPTSTKKLKRPNGLKKMVRKLFE